MSQTPRLARAARPSLCPRSCLFLFSLNSALPLLLATLVLGPALPAARAQPQTVKLGILMPFPTHDSAIPSRLADEWISALRVALVILGAEHMPRFQVQALINNSDCSYQAGVEAAKYLVSQGVVGVVGPACSEAVRGANSVFGTAGIPFISFAATLDEFSGAGYETFFRTVYADSYQAAAIAKVLSAFHWTKAILFYTDEAYGINLKDKIQAASSSITEWRLQKVAYPPPADPLQYLQCFKDESGNYLQTDEATIAILAVMPSAAEGLWKAALSSNDRQLLKWPWWYFGSDGTTAVDLVEQAGDSLANLTMTIQGQIGLAPYKGNYSPHSPLHRFLSYWAIQPYEKFPGLLTLPTEPRMREARPYVTNLIDAVWAFYYMIDRLLGKDGGKPITSQMLLDCLRDTSSGCAVFDGVSGTVGFNRSTGDRRTDLSPPRYDFNNLIDVAWAEKASVTPTAGAPFTVDPSVMLRPGPIPKGVQAINLAGQVAQAPTLAAWQVPPAVGGPLPAGFGLYDSTPSTSSQGQLPSYPTSDTGSHLSGRTTFGIIFSVLGGSALVGVGLWFIFRRSSNRVENQSQFVRML